MMGEGGEEEKVTTQVIKSSLAAELNSLLLVVPFATNKSVIYYPRLHYYVVAARYEFAPRQLKKFAPFSDTSP